MKKLIFNKTWLYLFALVSATFTSCLKDEGFENGEYGLKGVEGQQFVSIPKAKNPANVMAIESKDEAQEISLFEASYDFVNPTSKDITVTMELNNSLVAAYNEDYVVLPANAYTLPSTTLTIPAGKRLSDALKINLSTNAIDPTQIYGLGFKIASVSDPSIKIPSNLSNVLYVFTVKNKYDGEYEVTGTMVDNASATLTGYFPMKYYLITAGAREVDGFDPVVWEDYFIPIRSGSALSGYGSFSPQFKFDANDNIIEVINVYGQPAGNTRYAELDPSGENKWDEATQTIKVKFFMFQPNSVALPKPRVEFNWTMKRVGPRP